MIDRTEWDVCLSENAQVFFAEEMNLAEITRAPPEVFRAVLCDLTAMARGALVAITGWPENALETATDVTAMEPFVPADSPLYAHSVAHALALSQHCDSEFAGYMASPEDPAWCAVFVELLADLIERLRRTDDLARERWGLERERLGLERVASELRPDAARGGRVLQGARKGHEAVHGTGAEKAARWEKHKADYQEALSRLGKGEAAKVETALKHGVSTRTIERALQK